MKKRILTLLLAAVWLLPGGASASGAAPAAETVSLPILMYHHIRTDSGACNDYTILPETFEGDLRYLRDHGYETVSVADLLAYEAGVAELPEKPVMITFDDGQSSFAAYALPLLEQYDMCAVLAVVGVFADEYTESDDRDVTYAYLSWPELAELEQSPYVELAGHSYDMHQLSARRGCSQMAGESDAAYRAALEADLELEESRFREYLTDQPVAFAYPYGLFNAVTRQVLADRGYQVLFTCDGRVNHLNRSEGELLSLARYNRPFSADRDTFFRKMGIK